MDLHRYRFQTKHPLLSPLAFGFAALLFALSSAVGAPITSGNSVIPNSGNVIDTSGDIITTLGGTTFINHGLQGVGRVSASSLDQICDTLGSISGLAITNWAKSGSSYTGVFNTLPDRGFNAGSIFSDYAARIEQFDFTFTPYTGAANIGGTTTPEKVAAQNQIVANYAGGVKFTYDVAGGGTSVTTGLNPPVGLPGVGSIPIGSSVPFVTSYTPTVGPSAGTPVPVNKLTLDSEALVLKSDGSGYVGDEYGGNIYHFDSNKKIDAILPIPGALKPRAAGVTSYDAVNTPTDGRRNNQGFEGVSLSPDGKTLFVLAQGATVQDSGGGNQGRLNTRMLVYDVSSTATPSAPSAEYVVRLPTLNDGTDGSNLATPNKTAAQSEIIALDSHRILVLSRDSNGANIQGTNGVTNVPPKFKSVLLVDLDGAGTDIINLAGVNGDGEKITSSGSTLKPGITPLAWSEALNMLNLADLDKFNVRIDNFSTPDLLTMSEKWEGMALVSALDPLAPNDYFLFIANDNDFITTDGHMLLSDGSTTYNATNGAPGSWQNDTMFLAYRVSIVPDPGTLALVGLSLAGLGFAKRRKVN
jgi:hypothetical protein